MDQIFSIKLGLFARFGELNGQGTLSSAIAKGSGRSRSLSQEPGRYVEFIIHSLCGVLILHFFPDFYSSYKLQFDIQQNTIAHESPPALSAKRWPT